MTRTRDEAIDAHPALVEALSDWRTKGRLSDAATRALIARRRRTVAGTAGGVAAMLLAVGLPQHRPRAMPDRIASLHTERGGTKAVRLPDGTTMRLDGATRLSVRYTSVGRTVTLTEGAAFFDVTHDPARPFTVRAGDGDVRVLGTAFGVDRTAGRMEVSVYRGAVRLAGRGDERGERVPAGWRGHVVRGHASPPARLAKGDGAWRNDWLDTDGLSMADLVSILNRRSPRPIAPPPHRIGSLPISGRFRTGDAEALLSSIGPVYGFKLVHRHGQLALSPI
jgi:transmembrane sensor